MEEVEAVSASHLSKLRWRCRRGMRELDVAMLAYLEQGYIEAAPAQRAAFESLLDTPDPDLFGWITGREAAPEALQDVVDVVRGATLRRASARYATSV